MTNKRFVLSLLLFFGFTFQSVPLSAFQVDQIPSLVWERGKQQTVVLGTAEGENLWKLRLVMNGETSDEFGRTSVTDKGYYIYFLNLPQSQKLGNYSIEAYSGQVSRIVAYVQIIPLEKFEIVNLPRELTSVMLYVTGVLIILVLLHIRPRKSFSYFSHISLRERFLSGEYLPTDSSRRIVLSKTENLRLKLIQGLPNGILQAFLRMDWAFSRGAYRIGTGWFTAVNFFSVLIFSVYLVISESSFLELNFVPLIFALIFTLLVYLDLAIGIVFAMTYPLLTIILVQPLRFSDLVLAVTTALVFVLPVLILRFAVTLFFGAKKMNLFIVTQLINALTIHVLLILLQSITLDSRNNFILEILLVVCNVFGGAFSLVIYGRTGLSRANHDVEERNFTYGSLISTGFLSAVFLYFTSVYYVWTQSIISILASMMIVLVLYFLRIRFTTYFPKLTFNVPAYFSQIVGLFIFIGTGILLGSLQFLPFTFFEGKIWYLLLYPVPTLLFAVYAAYIAKEDKELVQS